MEQKLVSPFNGFVVAKHMLEVLRSMKTNYLRQRETANYWIETISINEKNLQQYLSEEERLKSQVRPKQVKETMAQQLREQKLEVLLNELFKTLESK